MLFFFSRHIDYDLIVVTFHYAHIIYCITSLQALGQVGLVLNTVGNGDLRVLVNGRRWVFNPLCLKSAPDESLPQDLVVDSKKCPCVYAP